MCACSDANFVLFFCPASLSSVRDPSVDHCQGDTRHRSISLWACTYHRSHLHAQNDCQPAPWYSRSKQALHNLAANYFFLFPRSV